MTVHLDGPGSVMGTCMMTSYYNHPNQNDFVCVDRDPEYVPETCANKDGAFLFFVEIRGRALWLFSLPSIWLKNKTGEENEKSILSQFVSLL